MLISNIGLTAGEVRSFLASAHGGGRRLGPDERKDLSIRAPMRPWPARPGRLRDVAGGRLGGIGRVL